MKKILSVLFLGFIGFTTLAQPGNLVRDKSSLAADSLRKVDSGFDRRFVNKGNKLLNMRGTIPQPHITVRPRSSGKKDDTSQEKLIANTLLFTGQLKDHISRPFMIYRDTLNLKAAE